MMRLEQISISHIGDREVNADFVNSYNLGNNRHFFIIADGLGDNEESASMVSLFCNTLASAIKEKFAEKFHDYQHGYLESIIHSAISKTFEHCTNPQTAKSKCVFAFVITDPEFVITAHMGDCRIYRINDGQISVTKDHTLKNKMSEENEKNSENTFSNITELGLFDQISQHAVTRTANIKNISISEIHVETPLSPCETIILCTDGFWRQAKEDYFISLSRASDLPATLKKIFEKMTTDESHKKLPDNSSLQLIRRM